MTRSERSGNEGLEARLLGIPVPRQDRIDNHHEQRSVSGPVLIVLGTTLFGILGVGNAFVLNAVVGAFSGPGLAVMLFLEVLLIGGVLLFRPELRPAVRWDPLEMLGMAVVGGAFLAHAILLAPTDLMPVSFSVDCSHQHLLVNYIYQHDRFPEGVDYLYIYDDYPVVPSALAAFSARLLGLLPAQTMYPVAVLLVAAQVMLVYGLGVELLPRRPASYLLATMAALAIFFAYPYSVQVFAERFYSNMMMGDLMVLLVLWVVTVRERLHPVFAVGVVVALVFGCLNSYPAWLPFVIIPALASVMLDRRMTLRQRLAMAGVVGGITAILAVVAAADQWDFITWFAPVRDRRLLPGWTSLGGVFLLLVVAGLWALSRNWRRWFGFALFLVVDLVLVVMLYGVALLDKLALYIPDKTFYFNIFLFAVLVAVGLYWLWERFAGARPGHPRVAGLLIFAAGLAALLIVNWRFPKPESYPITLDEYRVAYQVSQESPDAELAYLVRNATTFYWMYGCILNRTHAVEAERERWQSTPPTYESWIDDTTAPNRAIVSDLTRLPQDGTWREILRAGNSGLIEKAPWSE